MLWMAGFIAKSGSFHTRMKPIQYAIAKRGGSTLGERWNTTLIGRWANGPCYAVAVVGKIAYFGNGGYLEIVDFSNPANPVELGKALTPSVVAGVAVTGNHAYVVNGWHGLRIIDISDPSSPREVGYFDTGGYAEAVAVSGSYACVAYYEPYYEHGLRDKYGLRIIDISNPSSPREVGYFSTGSRTQGIAVSGSYAYLATDKHGLRIVDISNPSSPKEVGYFDSGGRARGVAVRETYAYVADYDDGSRVTDISNPSNQDRFLLFPGGKLHVVDISNPSRPRQVGCFRTGGEAYGVAVGGRYAYMADGLHGLRIIRVSNPSRPREVGYFRTGGEALGVAVSGSYAYLANHQAGLRVIDISNPSKPREVGYFDTGGLPWGVAVSGSYAYLADGEDGLYIIRNDLPTSVKDNADLSGLGWLQRLLHSIRTMRIPLIRQLLFHLISPSSRM